LEHRRERREIKRRRRLRLPVELGAGRFRAEREDHGHDNGGEELLAEAEGLQRKAEAWKNFNDAAVINMVVDKMPELAQAFATQLAGIDTINIIEMGNGHGTTGSGGVSKVMGTVGGGMTAMLSMLKDQFGVDIARLMEAKTEAATSDAEKRAGKRTETTPPAKPA